MWRVYVQNSATVTGNVAASASKGNLRSERTKMLACTHPAFDGPVVLFQDIIEILHGTVFTANKYTHKCFGEVGGRVNLDVL
jgi:hypothetical protein